MKKYRNLTDIEIKQLKNQGCSAESWSAVKVNEKFSTHNIHHVIFNGKIFLGYFNKILEITDGINQPSGIRNAMISNCTIGDDVYIANVRYMYNYQIANQVVIDNVDRLIVTGETTFGNGTELDVFNEGGGREVIIFDVLNAQIAYMMAAYRHDHTFIENLKQMINNYVQQKASNIGKIEEKTRINDCGKLINVRIGAFSLISGAIHLENGTIMSNSAAPTEIGSGVIAKSFIILSGSKVTDSAYIHKTFVGQGVRVGKQFSSENSLIFANSECFHSEACSLFAGPYTVTHHKSTLLIAGMFSFYNAGSGSNQSNHMYKLGPIQQGILERGSKTGSSSYMIWPSRVGAFSVVIGKHYVNFDNRDLPFSYILESAGKTVLIPALNFFTVGTRRDSAKWPNRDNRRDPVKMDLINFELFTPYIAGKVYQAIQILTDLKKSTDQSEKFIAYNGLLIEYKRLDMARQDYQLILDYALGEQILKKLESLNTSSYKTIRSELSEEKLPLNERWVDIFGLIAPLSEIDTVMNNVRRKKCHSPDDLHTLLTTIHKNYHDQAWRWYLSLLSEQTGKNSENLSADDLIQVLNKWEIAVNKINKRILEDASKEFSDKSRIGYGIDGDQNTSDADFAAVIGSFKDNTFVIKINEEIRINSDRAKAMIQKLKVFS